MGKREQNIRAEPDTRGASGQSGRRSSRHGGCEWLPNGRGRGPPRAGARGRETQGDPARELSRTGKANGRPKKAKGQQGKH